ncbi:MAG TPA: oxalate/formate MFS antiporter [Bryobacteraceae bacterium]|nr:oxalate/formate MFS antiporter [Bryobacteraceae bacterium]
MNRWIRLIGAVVAMMMIANLQYAWTLFVKPIVGATHWKLSDVQWGFSIFIALETWMMPFSGWLIEWLGPRAFMTAAGVMCGVGWAGLGRAKTLPELYMLYALAGFGAALVYCGSLGIALKWFPDKRGLAAGMISAGFGSGAALFIPLIAYLIRAHDYRTAFLYTGIGQGLIIIIAAQILQNPAAGVVAPAPAKVQLRSQHEDFHSFEMLRTPQFYVLFAMALMMGIGGLMATAQVAPMANTFKIGTAALTLSLTLNPLANGAARVFWGWVSDYLGRERTMFIAFLLQSVVLLGVVTLGHLSTTWFIVTMALVFFTWGEVYSLFPSICADWFGAKNVSSNYGFIYAAKGVASIVGGGLAATLYERTGSWNYGFYACSVLALITAMMALGLRKMPLPHKKPATSRATAVGDYAR